MSFLIIWVLFGIGAVIAASNKGRSRFWWFLLGVLLGPFALLYVLLIPAVKSGGTSLLQEEETKNCPHCAETIKLAAKKCRYCGETFTEEEME
ncbi:MAG: zinc ribbon domain-containing protein, partial [Syntrophales bacterium]|nr:zinc ribbon domain-containing protein [Syntrophales bacterium]